MGTLVTLGFAQEVFRFATLGVLVVLSAHLLRTHRSSSAARFGALFALCLCAYLILPFLQKQSAHGIVIGILLLPAFSNAFLLWMLCRSLFSEHAKVGGLHFALWAASQIAGYMVFYRVPEALFRWGGGVAEFDFIRRLIPQAFHLGFILAGILASQTGARSDLVASRIKLRRAFLATVAFYGLLICAAEILLQGQPASQGTEAFHFFILLILAGLFFREVLKHPDLLSASPVANSTPAAVHASQPVPVPEPTPLQKDLHHKVENEKVYRQEGLTIAELAKQMKTQEYLLRACINKSLGFRNFNDFLNHYRVREACSRLASEPGLPIFNLCLELGYGSLAPFNRAFKERIGKTPTQFRNEIKSIPRA